MTGHLDRLVRNAPGLVVQPRMGFSDAGEMMAGLRAVKRADATTIGTITLDSYTRNGRHDRAAAALRTGERLNGYPLVAHGPERTRELLDAVQEPSFPVQIRHGSPLPEDIFEAVVACGADATEGGPVSYCLPYGRVPLADTIGAWARACELLAAAPHPVHLETFGGCMMGQGAHPSLLVAISVLEGLFFRQHGVFDISLSYAQQSNHDQDVAALRALRRLTGQLLGDCDWHVVLYTWMGVYPSVESGAERLLTDSAKLALRGGAERLIVKTTAEAFRIPTVEENVDALEQAAIASARAAGAGILPAGADDEADEIYCAARHLVDAVLDGHRDVGDALAAAFRRGLLDVPYCLHPDNQNLARCVVDGTGRLQWSDLGRIPLPRSIATVLPHGRPPSSAELLELITFNARTYDALAAGADSPLALAGTTPFTTTPINCKGTTS